MARISNRPFRAVLDQADTHEDRPLTLNVRANDIGVGRLVTGVDATSRFGAALTLNPNGTVSYDPSGSDILQGLAAGQSRTDTFTYTLTSPDGRTSTATVQVTVEGRNDRPGAILDIRPAANAVQENAAAGTTVGLVARALDPDQGDHLTYSLTDDAGGRFVIDPRTGLIRVVAGADLDAEEAASHSIAVRASDGEAFSTTRFTIAVEDVNEAPTALTLSHASIAENSPRGTLVARLGTEDPEGGPFTYALVSGPGSADNRQVEIVGDEIRLKAGGLDHESDPVLNLRIQVTDDDGNSYTRALNVAVEDVNERPSSPLLLFPGVTEHAAASTVVARLRAQDPDRGDTLTYALAAGNGTNDADNSLVEIVGNQIRVKAGAVIDFETNPVLNLVVQVTDDEGLSSTRAVRINVANINENNAPTGLADGTASSVDENVAAGASIIDLDATDVDVGDTISYYFKDGTGAHVQTDGNFTIDASTGVVTTARAFDFETDGASLSFTAFAGDGNGGEDSGTYSVAVGNVSEPQVITFEGTFVDPIPDGYAGFNWESSESPNYGGEVDVYGGNVGGFNIAAGNEIAWNAFTTKNVQITRIDGNFNLVSLDLLNGYAEFGANTLVITAYDDNVQEQQITIDLTQAASLTTYTLNWNDIDSIKFVATGGIYSNGSGLWGMDNLVIT